MQEIFPTNSKKRCLPKQSLEWPKFQRVYIRGGLNFDGLGPRMTMNGVGSAMA